MMINHHRLRCCIAALLLLLTDGFQVLSSTRRCLKSLSGWVESSDGEWAWEEADPQFAVASSSQQQQTTVSFDTTATPRLPSGTFRPKQSLGQNYLKDPNTVAKILRTFHADATRDSVLDRPIIELGPGAGALTDKLVEIYGAKAIHCIEIDERSVRILTEKHPDLSVRHDDVLQIDYPSFAAELDSRLPLAVVGNLPYYITSQILFALADASHTGSVYSATVTMQWEVAQRMVAATETKDYGILSVVFQLYADTNLHFKIPPTVFYPKPKVDSALVGLHFIGPTRLRQRFAGVQPSQFRRVVTTAFQQRRKTVRNSLKKLAASVNQDHQSESFWNATPLSLPDAVLLARARGDKFALTQELPENWASKRPEELSPGQFVELTRLIYGPQVPTRSEIESLELENKVWRKLKHGQN